MQEPYNQQPISGGQRLGTMLLDHIIMCAVAAAFFLPRLLSVLSSAFKVSHEQPGQGLLNGPATYITLLGFALYFCKDIINGRSLAKRVAKLQVVDNNTGLAASPLQTFVRNLTCLLWPLEVIVARVNTSRRLGDFLAGTKLVRFDPSQEQPRINILKVLLPVCIAWGLIILPVRWLSKNINLAVEYNESSYNAAESSELAKLLYDNLDLNDMPDIRIYDSIKAEPLKYVSVIIKLRTNLLIQPAAFREFDDSTTHLIYSKYPRETVRGQIKYYFEKSGAFQSWLTTIGYRGKYLPQ